MSTDMITTWPERDRRKPRKPAQRKPLTKAELQQRREAAAKSTGPKSLEGKAASSRNGWKHGLTSKIHISNFDNGMKSLLGSVGKPCQTTCPKYPCSLVADGVTRPGQSCLDKQVYVQAFGAIIDAVENGAMEGIHGVMAAEVSATLQMLHDLRATINSQGLVIPVPMIDSEGNVIVRKDGSEVIGKYINNPGFPMMLKSLEVLGISLPELLATPQARARVKVEEEKTDAVQTLLGGIFQRANAAKGATAPLPSPRFEGPAMIEGGD